MTYEQQLVNAMRVIQQRADETRAAWLRVRVAPETEQERRELREETIALDSYLAGLGEAYGLWKRSGLVRGPALRVVELGADADGNSGESGHVAVQYTDLDGIRGEYYVTAYSD